jgi:hypothetical protein
MPRRQEDSDPRVTDLHRYRKARELQKRRPPPLPQTEHLLGGRPRAGLILVAVILALAALGILQHLP